ncbi:hypothetical protein Q8A67_023734 [Cirrhinus molitorella]|uniref:Uncharacterized protein n=1 Tax=Cirrhinus molitorella TaxID=172907 RepID=A0AA88TCU7_9TELE|nr:hypothetical protein Q8A67_023734 [Cirrhinus molitorella]
MSGLGVSYREWADTPRPLPILPAGGLVSGSDIRQEWKHVPCGDFTMMAVSCPEGCCLTSPQVSAAVFISQSLHLSPCVQSRTFCSSDKPML